MAVDERNRQAAAKSSYEEALNTSGFGKYNFLMLTTCCMLILAMYLDIFGFSVALPSAACDMGLTTSQQGMLSAIPLIGVMISSYTWGLCADTLGRRTSLLIAMPIGAVLNVATTLAPTFEALAALKFFSAVFTASASAAAFVLQGESVPSRHRNRFMFIMAGTTMMTQFLPSIVGLPVFKLTFSVHISWLALDYRPWRLLLQIISLPCILGVTGLLFLKESPKFLFSKGRNEAGLQVLKNIYEWNTGLKADTFPITTIYLDEAPQKLDSNSSVIRRMWNQTAPLFKPPLLKNSLKLYYLLLCAYMTATGFTMWVPTMTNAYFQGDVTSGKTFCEVASAAATNKYTNSTIRVTDCNYAINTFTLYAVMFYSGFGGVVAVCMTLVVGPLGKRRSTQLVFVVSIVCGILLLFVKVPMLSIVLFFFFLYVSVILGTVNTYLVELNPTYLRGMATCLSVVVARGFGFFSVQMIAALLADHCTPMLIGYIVLTASGLVVAMFLPKLKTNIEEPNSKKTQTEESLEANKTQL